MSDVIRSVGIALVAVGAGLLFNEADEVPALTYPSTGILLLAGAVAMTALVATSYARSTDAGLIVLALASASVLVTFGLESSVLLLAGGYVFAAGMAATASATPSMAALLGVGGMALPPALHIWPLWTVLAVLALAMLTVLEKWAVIVQPDPVEASRPQLGKEPTGTFEETVPVLAGAAAPAGFGPGYVVVESAHGKPRWSRTQDHEPPTRATISQAGHSYDGFALGGAVVRGASHVGYRHTQDGTERQDSYAIVQSHDGTQVHAVVADGVSSASHAGAGAAFACNLIASRLAQGEAVDEVLIGLSPDLTAQADVLYPGVSHEQFSTTTIVATVDVQDSKAAVSRIGDSTAFTLRDGVVTNIFDDDERERATAAIPSASPPVEREVVALGPGDILLLCTDGVAEHLALSAETRAAFLQHLAEVPSALDFCRLIGFEARQAHDDQTAVAIWNQPP